eukprot:2160241-Alexandrium_andersonii.AAC.1
MSKRVVKGSRRVMARSVGSVTMVVMCCRWMLRVLSMGGVVRLECHWSCLGIQISHPWVPCGVFPLAIMWWKG